MRLAYHRLTGPRPMDFTTLLRDAYLEDGPFGDHLRTLLVQLNRYDKLDLVAALRQVAAYGTLPNDGAFHRLRGAGLVRKQGSRIVPANQLYARFFGGGVCAQQ